MNKAWPASSPATPFQRFHGAGDVDGAGRPLTQMVPLER